MEYEWRHCHRHQFFSWPPRQSKAPSTLYFKFHHHHHRLSMFLFYVKSIRTDSFIYKSVPENFLKVKGFYFFSLKNTIPVAAHWAHMNGHFQKQSVNFIKDDISCGRPAHTSLWKWKLCHLTERATERNKETIVTEWVCLLIVTYTTNQRSNSIQVGSFNNNGVSLGNISQPISAILILLIQSPLQ